MSVVAKRQASDLFLMGGQPPVMRIDGHMQRIVSRRLEGPDCVGFMQVITPEGNQHELDENGGTVFGLAFDDQACFRIAVFKQRGKIGLVLHRLTVDGKEPS
jgi:twitching motility protein PilT